MFVRKVQKASKDFVPFFKHAIASGYLASNRSRVSFYFFQDRIPVSRTVVTEHILIVGIDEVLVFV